MFRLRQRHSRHLQEANIPASVEKLIAAQFVRAAFMAATITIIIVNILSAYTASVSGWFFPGIAIIQGAPISIAVQKGGRGLDWRFPLTAGAAAWTGAVGANLFIALVFTATETGAVSSGWWQILRSFFANAVSIVDVIYALCAVAVTTF